MGLTVLGVWDCSHSAGGESEQQEVFGSQTWKLLEVMYNTQGY